MKRLIKAGGATLPAFHPHAFRLARNRIDLADASGSTEFTYTPTGQVESQYNVIGNGADAGNYTTGYAYDALDRLSRVTYPDGKIASYSYADGRLRTVTATVNGTAQVVADTMRYQPFGPLTGLRYGNDLYRDLDFDNDARLIDISTATDTGTVVQRLSLAWNARDEITGIGNARDALLTPGYTYDALGRLTGAGRGDGTAEGFGYDAVGNRVSHSRTGQATAILNYGGTANRLLSRSEGSTSRLWTYDGNGNANGFTGADGVAVGLNYDAFGRVVASSRKTVSRKTVSGTLPARRWRRPGRSSLRGDATTTKFARTATAGAFHRPSSLPTTAPGNRKTLYP